MAFTSPITLDNGYHLSNAYIRVSIKNASKTRINIQLEIWDSPELKAQIPHIPVRFATRALTCTKSSEPKDDLIALAYQLLEESGEFADAVWNV